MILQSGFAKVCRLWFDSAKTTLDHTPHETKVESEDKPLCCDCFGYIQILTDEVASITSNYKLISENVLKIGKDQAEIHTVLNSHSEIISDVILAKTQDLIAMPEKQSYSVVLSKTSEPKLISELCRPRVPNKKKPELGGLNKPDNINRLTVEKLIKSSVRKVNADESTSNSLEGNVLNDNGFHDPYEDSQEDSWEYTKQRKRKNKPSHPGIDKPSRRETRYWKNEQETSSPKAVKRRRGGGTGN